MTAPLKLYNSLTREKVAFEPIDPSHIRIYACGPTVYSYAHIGNARMAVVFDVLANILRNQYPKVTYVSNITDVDDKIIAASHENNEKISVITEKYTRIYNEDMAALNIAPPDIQPRATTHIPHMIALIEKLITAEHAYAADGHVLFHVPSFPAYGGLSGRSRDEQIAGARVEIASYKKDPADFVLWKPSVGDEPGWDSPWGFGRPGWHIECSAMAEEHLGLPFDIHGGGADLKFPHHENEIAQSCCAHGHDNDLSAFAKYWVHNGFVTVNGEKMSKSLGNFTTVNDLRQKNIKGEVIRFALLRAHYRQPLDWSEKLLEQTKKQLDQFYTYLRAYKDEPTVEVEIYPAFIDALLDDLNTAGAIAAIHKMAGQIPAAPVFKAQLLKMGELLGIFKEDPDVWLGFKIDGDTKWIEDLLIERADAKKFKNFKRADEIRNELLQIGITIEDTSQGAIWKKIR